MAVDASFTTDTEGHEKYLYGVSVAEVHVDELVRLEGFPVPSRRWSGVAPDNSPFGAGHYLTNACKDSEAAAPRDRSMAAHCVIDRKQGSRSRNRADATDGCPFSFQLSGTPTSHPKQLDRRCELRVPRRAGHGCLGFNPMVDPGTRNSAGAGHGCHPPRPPKLELSLCMQSNASLPPGGIRCPQPAAIS
jgi:hypothetical protein